jgi:hypothetical protein
LGFGYWSLVRRGGLVIGFWKLGFLAQKNNAFDLNEVEAAQQAGFFEDHAP